MSCGVVIGGGWTLGTAFLCVPVSCVDCLVSQVLMTVSAISVNLIALRSSVVDDDVFGVAHGATVWSLYFLVRGAWTAKPQHFSTASNPFRF